MLLSAEDLSKRFGGVAALEPVDLELERGAVHAVICPNGAGALFTIQLRGGYEACIRFVDSLNIFSHVANLGDARSLVIHPASTTHRQLDVEQQKAAGAGPDVVRLSVGIETVDDIIADLDQALKAAA